MNKLPYRLKYLRVSNGLTQDKLSKDIEEVFGYPISKSTISQYENGNRESLIPIREIDNRKIILYGFPKKPYEIIATRE